MGVEQMNRITWCISYGMRDRQFYTHLDSWNGAIRSMISLSGFCYSKFSYSGWSSTEAFWRRM